jgi:hypothetical protein
MTGPEPDAGHIQGVVLNGYDLAREDAHFDGDACSDAGMAADSRSMLVSIG